MTTSSTQYGNESKPWHFGYPKIACLRMVLPQSMVIWSYGHNIYNLTHISCPSFQVFPMFSDLFFYAMGTYAMGLPPWPRGNEAIGTAEGNYPAGPQGAMKGNHVSENHDLNTNHRKTWENVDHGKNVEKKKGKFGKMCWPLLKNVLIHRKYVDHGKNLCWLIYGLFPI